MPCIEYVPKNFRGSSLELIDYINVIVTEYEKQGYNLTLRQIYYQLVARDVISNNERSYKNTGALISEARLAGLIDWYAVEDRTRSLRKNSHWETPAEIISSVAYSYELDHWIGQEYYVEVWVEKDALVQVVGQACSSLDVSYFSCRGYVSQSEMWVAAERLRRRQDEEKRIVLLHLGDHDPSGKDMSRDIIDRLTVFGIEDMDFKRIALNYDQVETYNPPPNPTKISDSRAQGYIGQYGHECWELDALDPKVITQLIQDYVTPYRDDDLYQDIIDQEDRDKVILSELSDRWNDIQAHWETIKLALD
jgi:hypothetical protein